MWWQRWNDKSHKWMQQTVTKGIKTKQEWVGKVIHWELCKRSKFDHNDKWYIKQNLFKNMRPIKILGDYEIQMNHLIPARRPDLVLITKTKRTCHPMDFAVPVDHRVKIKVNKNINKYLDLARDLKKLWNKGDENVIWNDPQGLEKVTGRIGNQGKNKDHQEHNIKFS